MVLGSYMAVVFPHATNLATIWHGIYALSIAHIVFEFAFVNGTRHPCILTVACNVRVDKFALVHITIGVSVFTFAMFFSIEPLALVDIASRFHDRCGDCS